MLTQSENKIARIRNNISGRFEVLTAALEIINDALQNEDLELFKGAQNSLANFERINLEIDNMIIATLATIGAEGKDLRELIAFLKITNETNRISSNARALTKKLQLYVKDGAIGDIKQYVTELCKCAINMSEIALQTATSDLANEEGEIYRKMAVEETKSDDLYALLEKKCVEGASDGIKLSAKDYQRLNAVRKLEKISDRFMAIGALIEFAKHGGKLDMC
ncbi:hypothetical protein FACS189487_02820 [Campylobacterota bacterium]|nr:hypothetical protein FACS189487_02820 [Campylobacterota bacterium]